ncbi:glutamate-1-semialdehyde 2,1-aminomutase [candidate division KSB1 bacterium]|nr:glutamate-1-semialdehyde 2,1-aminomutase [candidate division KSB1 bacterium]
MKIGNSEKLFEQAQKVLPGGVNSPVRAFKAVGGTPLFISRAEGPYLFDVDGNRYVDYVCSWGPMILGHADPQVMKVVQNAIKNSTSYGAPTEVEVELANMVVEAVPSIEMVRFVNSGTEATMSALRLARAYTKCDKIIKFEGCYHGHADMLLVQAGSGVTTLGLPDSPGVPRATVEDTLLAQYNNLDSVKQLFETYLDEIAAVIVEPVAGNMGVVPPQSGFLEGLREITKAHNSLLVFDEIITGFRVAYGGAQSLFDVLPDLTCLGKIVGGGFPVGAYGGRKEIMELVAPSGPVYQAGTLSGNPVAMTAGLETLKVLKKTETYNRLDSLANQLASGIKEAAESTGVPVFQARVGSMLSLFFADQEVLDLKSAKTSDAERYRRFFHSMLTLGYYFAPSQFESVFVSLAHDEQIIANSISAISEAFNTL